MTNKFNLVDENWIPVVDVGLVSLRRVFSDESLFRLGGTPIEKISMLKFLQAIAQAAASPKTENDWRKIGNNLQAFGKECICYLENRYANFDLYGEHPFLQMKQQELKEAKTYLISTRQPFIASGNNLFVRQSQIPTQISDAKKALILLSLMSCDLGGKRHDKNIKLQPNYEKKSAHAGPAIAENGALHSFCLGDSILKTIWFNTFTLEEISKLPQCKEGLGVPPWDQMPKSEDDTIARKLKNSLMGRLVPMSRFCIIDNDSFHLTEGLWHKTGKDFSFDPSQHINLKKASLTWCDPEKRPWRELVALFSYLDSDPNRRSITCQQVWLSSQKLLKIDYENISVWSGGLQVSTNSGEQKASGLNDFIESECVVTPTEDWYSKFINEMMNLQKATEYLQKRIVLYFKSLETTSDNPMTMKKKSTISDKKASAAMKVFWGYCDCFKQRIIEECDTTDERKAIRKVLVSTMLNFFNETCPHNTPQQIRAWALSKPDFGKYLNS